MQNHYFDDALDPGRPYTHSLPATPNTAPPDNALRGALPDTSCPGFWPCECEGAWVQVEDHRGQQGWLNDQWQVIKVVGPLPAGWSTTAPEPALRPEEKRKLAIAIELDRIDRDSIRPLRAVNGGVATLEDHTRLTTLENQAQSLRAELAGLGG